MKPKRFYQQYVIFYAIVLAGLMAEAVDLKLFSKVQFLTKQEEDKHS